MLKILLIVTIIAALAASTSKQRYDPTNQLVDFKAKTMGLKDKMTTNAGAPVNDQDTESLNTNLLRNENLMDGITHLTRERIPERVTHAKGAGAFGYFETTRDISHICKAKIFSGLGKKTPIAVRFSTTVFEKGGADTLPDVRGFAVKFYTEDGNFDIAGLNMPIFSFKDPAYFGSFLHSQKKNPVTNLFDKNAAWDFYTLHPESFFSLLLTLSDRGIPDGYRHMPGYSIHTYEVYNEKGIKSFIRFHFEPEAGIKNLNFTEGTRIAGLDADYATRDLYTAIGNGENPSWLLKLQILSEADVKKASFDIYDVTRTLPEDIYPLHQVGRLVLNKNPINYFAEMEQLAFCPGNLICGILGSPDKFFELRCLAYRDAQNYRLGVNFKKMRVNCPFTKVSTYNRDGIAPVKDNEKDAPNYFPNSFNGPTPHNETKRPSLSRIYEKEPYNFDQVANFYLNELTSDERVRLIENIISDMCPIALFLKERAIKIFTIINSDLGKKIAKGIANKCPKL